MTKNPKYQNEAKKKGDKSKDKYNKLSANIKKRIAISESTENTPKTTKSKRKKLVLTQV